LPIILSIFVT